MSLKERVWELLCACVESQPVGTLETARDEGFEVLLVNVEGLVNTLNVE